jgi:hypothetical protein
MKSEVQILSPRLGADASACGSGAVVAHLPSKQIVAGSSPVSRSTLGNGPGHARVAGAVPYQTD